MINETLRYRQVRTYFFQPDMSEGKEEDVIVLINEPMMVNILNRYKKLQESVS